MAEIPLPRRSSSALIVTDIQYDFMPGGALAVGDGDAILPGVSRLMTSGGFPFVVATQDWHPAGHISFASQHEGVSPFDTLSIHGHEDTAWPDHCVQGTRGAELCADLPWDRACAVLRKGMDPESDSYSTFRNNWDRHGNRPPTGLAGYLRERGVDSVVLCGLARDVCVYWSAMDAVAAGFHTWFLWDLTRAVVPEKDEENRRELEQHGVTVCTMNDLLNASGRES
ncbi:nicotinamidase [Kiritimatiella glycovorans]|uniref:nicotinamidase n=1 Tax=Kiritimatiella glycovorans TaxID=1307763 RepID=A0A0G3EGV3_9BACT|nr:nicotinamidase [Kiritimatiella glycovorans]AKJ64652.1 nicotinamidase/pyrazinamidase [Kiritimatiella glycovorans]